ncbi:DUF6790 family protein [Salidesulfovibrio onnuriiensis]|uniref:DUF6790 family protein n=1 Tax=Salidesulfovibrio onnuriiensis TaxID=2583823 RepID=UPI0011CCDDB6|nr:DUF6790 family protein [Salidesulfovibrio onnuriiensis]
MYVVYLAVLALLIAGVDIIVRDAPIFATLLLWLLVIKVGLGGIWAFMGHYFKSEEVAAYIGWPAGNPFQKEVAFTNLALGCCGLLCFFFRDGFWLATIVFASVFLLGAFSVHMKNRDETGNTNPGNAGPVFYADILGPVALWVLYFLK